MHLPVLLAFTAALAVAVAIPGPGIFAVVSCALGRGFRDALALITGMILGEVARYNEAVDARLDREAAHGKALAGCKRFDTPPYYAIQLFPLARKNFGGVKTDLRCRGLDPPCEPIPGLDAAGVVAGRAGGNINGKAGLAGTRLGPALFRGRVAGGWAAHEAGFGPGFVGRGSR